MRIEKNLHRGVGLPDLRKDGLPRPSTDSGAVARLLALCPAARETPLMSLSDLAAELRVGALMVKDESQRMGLGSFKALGAAYVIARDAEASMQADRSGGDWPHALAGRSYVTASAGNHGLSVAAGARAFGAKAVIYLSESVPEAFAARLRAFGAEVRRAGAVYEDSMAEAARAARAEGLTLLSDSSWPGYLDIPYRVMEGYLQLASEAAAQVGAPPTHIFLQAGVGGLAAAVAAFARNRWGDGPIVIVVEPEAAPALIESQRAGRVVVTKGPVSSMGRLDCKEPSLLALAGLAEDADFFATITEAEAGEAVRRLGDCGLPSTPSGAAGLAGLIAAQAHRSTLGLDDDSRVLIIVSEGAEAA